MPHRSAKRRAEARAAALATALQVAAETWIAQGGPMMPGGRTVPALLAVLEALAARAPAALRELGRQPRRPRLR